MKTVPLMFMQRKRNLVTRDTVACSSFPGDIICYRQKSKMVIVRVESVSSNDNTTLLQGTVVEYRHGKKKLRGGATTKRVLPNDYKITLIGTHDRIR